MNTGQFRLAILLILVIPMPVAAQSGADLKPAAHAIRDARVVVEPGTVLEKATVVIRDGLIVGCRPGRTRPAGRTGHGRERADGLPGLPGRR